MKKLLALILALAMVFSLVACVAKQEAPAAKEEAPAEKEEAPAEKEEAPAEEGGTIFAIFKDSSSVFFADMGKGAKKAAEELGYDIVIQNPASEAEIDKQIAMVESAIEADPVGMIVSCISSDALIGELTAVKEAGIPLTCADAGDNEHHYDALYMTDCYQAAWDLCEYTVELMNYEGTIYLLNAVAGVQSCDAREKGFRECAAQYENVEIINDWQDCDNDKTVAANMTLDLLTARDDDITAMVGLNENAVMGIATAIEERGLAGEIIVTGVDCSVDVQAYLRQGVIQGTSTQDPYKMGYMAVYGLQQVINGEDLNHAIIDTGSAIVTAENIDDPEIQAVINPK